MLNRFLAVLCLIVLVAVNASAAPMASGATVYIEKGETLDSSNARDKANYTDFGLVLTAALAKKQVPVTVVLDEAKADYIIKHTSSFQQDSTGTRIAKIAVLGAWGLGRGGVFEGTVMVVNRESSAVVFSFTTKKGKAQSGAENFAGKFKAMFQ